MKRNNILVFFTIVVVFNMAANFAHPVTPTVIKDLQLGDYMFGVALGSMMICNFLFSPFWGKLNNYVPSKNTMFVCASGYAIGQIFFGIANSEIMIIIARIFAGIFIGGSFVSFLTYTVNTATDENRARNLMINATIQSVAGAFGFFIGGLLGEISVLGTFIIQAITLLVSGILFYFLLVDDRKEVAKIEVKRIIKEANPFNSFKSCANFMTVTFLCLFIVGSLVHLGYTAFEQSFNYYLKDQFGLTSSYNGMIKAGIGFISLAANSTICLYLMRKTNVAKSIITVLFISTFALLGTVLINDLQPFIIVNIIFFAFYAISVPLIQDLIAKRGKEKDSNIVMGFYNATKSLGGIIGAFVAGGIYTVEPKSPFIFGTTIFLLACVFAFIYYRRSKKRT